MLFDLRDGTRGKNGRGKPPRRGDVLLRVGKGQSVLGGGGYGGGEVRGYLPFSLQEMPLSGREGGKQRPE